MNENIEKTGNDFTRIGVFGSKEKSLSEQVYDMFKQEAYYPTPDIKFDKKPTYLLIKLKIQDGERQYDLPCLHITNAKAIEFTVNLYTARFWGKIAWRDKNTWYFWGGEIAVKWTTYHILTEEEYELFNKYLNS